MSNPPPIYIIDANVLMQAHRLYYAFPICPGFWDFLVQQHQGGRIISLDRVHAEIDPGDALHRWVQSTAPPTLFASTQDAGVGRNFGNLAAWVQANTQFTQAAKDEFARVADGWLVAYAQAHPNHVVVTMEERADGAKKKVPLPNVCLQFGVRYTDTFTMVKELGGRFVLDA
jgi:Domain of unknown function (DUF4411)